MFDLGASGYEVRAKGSGIQVGNLQLLTRTVCNASESPMKLPALKQQLMLHNPRVKQTKHLLFKCRKT